MICVFLLKMILSLDEYDSIESALMMMMRLGPSLHFAYDMNHLLKAFMRLTRFACVCMCAYVELSFHLWLYIEVVTQFLQK